LISVFTASAQVAKTPPMGWNSWNHYHCNLNETLIKQTADAFISKGLNKAGYVYVNLDDCWQISRASDGTIQWDTTKFPNGIPSLAEYIHNLTLKFGLYTDRGTKTCQGRPGSYGYEQKDAQTYASWKVDYVKNDDCNIPSGGDANTDYGKMYKAINATGRPMIHSVKGSEPIAEADTVSNMRRTGHDIQDTYASMMDLVETNNANAKYAHAGFWNDIDMLEIGNGGMTAAEERTHMTMWCICKAPLILGNDIMSMSAADLALVTDSEAIAINQDSLGIQATKKSTNGNDEVWAGNLANKDIAVALVNKNDTGSSTINVTWTEIGLSSTQVASVRDIWQKKDMGNHTGSYSASVPFHDVAFLRITPH
jgi:alpha-galactosidase